MTDNSVEAISKAAVDLTVVEAPQRETGFYQPYADFARHLRTWFVAYGVGAPVLFATQDTLLSALIGSGWGRAVAVMFLSGVGLQVLSTILYKAAMWHLYAGELDPKRSEDSVYAFSEWVSESFALEITMDLLTLALFGAATALALSVMVPAAPT